MIDLHVHTHLSCDSEETMERYIQMAEQKGVSVICFTDHVDLNPVDYGYRYYKPDRFFEDLALARAKAPSGIELLAGMEFGETHLYADECRSLSKYPYDFVLGSIHWVNDLFPDEKVQRTYSARQFFDMYWEEMLKMVKAGSFDSLAHIDFPKRYYGELYYEEKKLREIFMYLLDKDASLEINTSSVRRGYPECMPGREILEIYKLCGGRHITVGSDSHFACDIGADADSAQSLIDSFGFKQVLYRQRKRIPV